MSTSPVAPARPGTSSDAAESTTRLHGVSGVVAQVCCFIVIVLGLVAFAHSVPGLVYTIEHPCTADACTLTPAQARSVVQLGISLQVLGIFVAAYYILFEFITTVLAGIVLWRRGNDWMALLVSLMLVLYPDVGNVVVNQGGFWYLLTTFIYVVGETLFYLTFALFPNGRLVPRLMIVPVIGWVALHVVTLQIPNWLTGVSYLVLYVCVICSQMYRYRRLSSVVEQQQTKWVVFGIVFVLLANIAYWQPFAFISALQAPDSLYPVFGFLAYQLLTLVIPISFGVAILRYRLYDIDILINRSLVYGTLTVILALLYAIGIFVLQAAVDVVLQTQGGDISPFVIVVSTLMIAALFRPLRSRIQTLIDQRFYRRKYDAARILEAFGSTLRQEVDIHELQTLLLEVVAETMQPTHVSLWLQPPEHEEPLLSRLSRQLSNDL